MTTTGSTKWCSAKRKIAFGSERSTDVSSTYVRSPTRPFESCLRCFVVAGSVTNAPY